MASLCEGLSYRRTFPRDRIMGGEVVGFTQVGALATRSLTALRDGNTAQAQASADAARGLVASWPPAQRHLDAGGLAELGWAESWLERYGDAERHLRAGIAAARRTGREDLLPRLLVALAHVACWTGQLPAAVRLARGARRHGDRDIRGAAFALESIAVLWIGGRDSRAGSLVLARAAVGQTGLDGWSGRLSLAALGQARLFSDDAAGCRQLVLGAGRDARLTGLPASLRPMWLSLLSATALQVGDVDAAEAWALRAEAMVRHVALAGQRAFAAMASGQVLVRRGDPAGAAAHLRSASAGFGQSGMVVLQALALVAGAHATAAAGDSLSAIDMLQCAHRVAVSCGSLRIVDMVARAMPGHPPARRSPIPSAVHRTSPPLRRTEVAADVLARRVAVVGTRSAAGAEPPWPAENRLNPLTARERQIARIAGAGTKTGTIARQLGVSPRTIDVHLSRIYRKLGVPGRAGLVAIVARMEPVLTVLASHPPAAHQGALVAHCGPEDLGQQVGQPSVQARVVALDVGPGRVRRES
jgi:DNA-binding CsgD family transcriptional regulator